MPTCRPSHAPSPARPGVAPGSSESVPPARDRTCWSQQRCETRCPNDLFVGNRAGARNDEAYPTKGLPLRRLSPRLGGLYERALGFKVVRRLDRLKQVQICAGASMLDLIDKERAGGAEMENSAIWIISASGLSRSIAMR